MNCSKFNIYYSKNNTIDHNFNKLNYILNEEDIDNNYNPFDIEKEQLYNPIYNLFFSLTDTNYNNISLNHKYHIINLNTVKNIDTRKNTNKEIFFKYSPLIDPTKYLIGKYTNDDTIYNLPQLNENNSNDKLTNIHNASYIDNFFYYLSDQLLHKHKFLNGLEYYGSYLAIQKIFKYNLTDEIEYFDDSSFFHNQLGSLFTISNSETNSNKNTRNKKNKIKLSDDNYHNLTCNQLPSIEPNEETPGETNEETPGETNEELNLIYEFNNSNTNDDSSCDSDCNYSSSDNNSITEIDDDEWETESSCSENSCSENDTYAYIKNYPTQIICLEKCNDTIDTLFENNLLDDKLGSAALLQVIFSLLTFQKAFNFTHNDLHTNNIMFSNTDLEFLYYKYNNKFYKVPTYGRIFKIIDFGRSIYKYNNITFCSDSFSKEGDANTQYNCEPFYDEKKTRIEPNYSFDLCRLGCSIYDFIEEIEDNEDNEESRFIQLKNTINRWCTDDNNKNILYKKSGEERYPNFKLYKMIARNVHNHTPEKQLEFPFFNQYIWNENLNIDNIDNIIDIDSIPSYVKN